MYQLPSSSGDHCQYFKKKISCSLFELLPDGDGVGNLVVQEAVNKVEDKTVVSETKITELILVITGSKLTKARLNTDVKADMISTRNCLSCFQKPFQP